MVFVTLAFLGAFGADQGLLTYFADLSGPGLPYTPQDQKRYMLPRFTSIYRCAMLHSCTSYIMDSLVGPRSEPSGREAPETSKARKELQTAENTT